MLSAKSKSYQTSLKFACLVMDAKKWKNEGWGTLWDNITHIRTGCGDCLQVTWIKGFFGWLL